MSEGKARHLRAIGKDRKGMRAMGAKALEQHIGQLEEAVNYNGKAAVAATEAYRLMSWAYFWSQVAMAALLQHLENNMRVPAGTLEDPFTPRMKTTVYYTDIEAAVLFVPPPGEEGPQI